jgi:hypothetical protein
MSAPETNPNTNPDTSSTTNDSEPASESPSPKPAGGILQLPGLIAISLYMFLLAVVIVFGVVAGGHYPPLFLVLSVMFIAASGGLMRLLRWAWALALAAVLLLAIYNLWIFFTLHQAAGLVQGLLNVVFFLYLVRTEVREKLV